MPGGKPGSVKCEACLSRECAAEGFSAGQHRGSIRSETDRFAELCKIFRLQLFAFDKSLDVARGETSLLKRELRRTVQRGIRVSVKRDVAESEYVFVLREL